MALKGGVSETNNTGETEWKQAGVARRTMTNEDLGTGYNFGFSAGKYVTNNFRVELEVSRRGNYEYDARTTSAATRFLGNISSDSLLLNGLYDFPRFSIRSTSVTPYLGVGFGVSRNKSKDFHSHIPGTTYVGDKSINEGAYKVAAGILASLTEKLSIDVNYQYVSLGAFESSNKVIASIH
jgi:opacity protein-like surface antigen